MFVMLCGAALSMNTSTLYSILHTYAILLKIFLPFSPHSLTIHPRHMNIFYIYVCYVCINNVQFKIFIIKQFVFKVKVDYNFK